MYKCIVGSWRQNEAEAPTEPQHCTNEKSINSHTLRCTTNSKTNKCFWHFDHIWSSKKNWVLKPWLILRLDLLTFHMNCNTIQADGLHTLDTIDLQDHNLNKNSTYSGKAFVLSLKWWGIYYHLLKIFLEWFSRLFKVFLTLTKYFFLYTHKIR